MSTYPPWVVLHVPHDSRLVPEDVRPQFVLGDDELSREMIRMTDHFTFDIFAVESGDARVIRAPVSRLVVDVERFPIDADEPMAARGMGAVYTNTSTLTQLRRELSAEKRESLMADYYHPHHSRLEAAVANALKQHGRCLVLDCHSFPGTALPYEMANESQQRPDICIGTDSFHTPPSLAHAFVEAFESSGWRVRQNDPFAGALVPASSYNRDARVMAIMVEVNRRLYLDEESGTPSATYAQVAKSVKECCWRAISSSLGPTEDPVVTKKASAADSFLR